MTSRIAIVGMACQYPDASSPKELWENVLTQRRSFRRLPPQRLSLQNYFSEDRETPDCTYSNQAALIEGYEFDRIRFRVAGNTFRSSDMAHWLALDVAGRALMDAGFMHGDGLPRESTRVIVGNTLTGDTSRANSLRLRWPYVRRSVQATIDAMGLQKNVGNDVIERLERQFKSPFPPTTEETLAGGLSNTIAGRICNHFDLKGGGYSIDGACASSLLAVAQACSALSSNEADVVIAGGVDVSLDPFELVGFAKAGALASGQMKVFDAGSDGFLPGEGCGFVILMRSIDARQRGLQVHGTIRGWGISSDGKGGITRPVKEGQILALKRAYAKAGFSPSTVQYFEAHGTGTAVGDDVELQSLAHILREAGDTQSYPVVGSIKTNIGHTKAAAGVAGLVKAVMAAKARLVPPTVGCTTPSAAFKSTQLRVTNSVEPWPRNKPSRVGVSAMGFGGINSHIVVEGPTSKVRTGLRKDTATFNKTPQDVELFVFGAETRAELAAKINRVRQYAHSLALSELADLAARLSGVFGGIARAAVVAGSPRELDVALSRLEGVVSSGQTKLLIDPANMVFFGVRPSQSRIGFLLPGQGVQSKLNSMVYRRRFPHLCHFLNDLTSQGTEALSTETSHSIIVKTNLAGISLLQHFGIRAKVAVGHSLGELVSLHWGGAYDQQALLRLAEIRGNSMGACRGDGGMVAVGSSEEIVRPFIKNTPIVLACVNAPSQVVVSGPAETLRTVCKCMGEAGLQIQPLKVSHAFHSPMMEPAKHAFADQLMNETLSPLRKKVISTVTGKPVGNGEDLRHLLIDQLTKPVRFEEAMSAVIGDVDLLIEVGLGRTLSDLARQCLDVPAISIDFGNETLGGLLTALGAAVAAGANVKVQRLFDDRRIRPFSLDWKPKFFNSPCEETQNLNSYHLEKAESNESNSPAVVEPKSSLEIMREIIARRCELPLKSISTQSRFLDDLHLNSLTVSELIVETSRQLGVAPPPIATQYSNSSIQEAVDALKLRPLANETQLTQYLPSGIDQWVRSFSFDLHPAPLKQKVLHRLQGDWKVFSGRSSLSSKDLRELLRKEVGGGGVLAILPTNSKERALNILLEATDKVLEEPNSCFIVVQSGLSAAGFARSLRAESPATTICVIDVAEAALSLRKIILEEAKHAVGFKEVFYDAVGKRYERSIRLIPSSNPDTPSWLREDDVLLVTGGGKGIGMECALALAQDSGCSVGLIGRGEIDTDELIAQNRLRFEAMGIRCRYVSADVAIKKRLEQAVSEIETALGGVTAVLHTAGVNKPARLSDLKREDFLTALGPKVTGLANLLSVLNADKLRMIVAFGSIIAQTGMQGEAHYALANDWLAKDLEVFESEHKGCKCLALEWSVWSGVGMGERLGVLEGMRSRGIEPIPIDAGIKAIRGLVNHPPAETRVVVTSRFGGYKALGLVEPELPFQRFLEFPRLYYPAIELITECELSHRSDHYLDDHMVANECIFPAVMALEASIQVAGVLVGPSDNWTIENVAFTHPISAPETGSRRIRIAGLVGDSGEVEVAIRSDSTSYAFDHARLRCKPGASLENSGALPVMEREAVSVDNNFYGSLIFQGPRFHAVQAYRKLSSTECIAELHSDCPAPWFNGQLPSKLMLECPSIRDAAIHAVQACIPNHRVLPVAVARIRILRPLNSNQCIVRALQIDESEEFLTYSLEIFDSQGTLCEQWSELKLKTIEQITPKAWSGLLLSPYLERVFSSLFREHEVRIAVECSSRDREARAAGVLRTFEDFQRPLYRRADGKLIAPGKRGYSISHTDGLTIAAAARCLVGLDVEAVVARRVRLWQDLLGPELWSLSEFSSIRSGEDPQAVGTRVWAAQESLKKLGKSAPTSLQLVQTLKSGVMTFRSGTDLVATHICQISGLHQPVAVAVALPETLSQTEREEWGSAILPLLESFDSPFPVKEP